MKTPDRARSLAGENCAASASSIVPQLKCKSCGYEAEPSLTWNGPHIEASCRACGRHIQFLEQTPAVLNAAPPRIIQMSMFKGAA